MQPAEEFQTKKYTVLFDGQCGLCQRSIRVLRATDWFGRFDYLDFNQMDQVLGRFPELKNADFENAMYAVSPDGENFRGFFAFRRLIWCAPPLWLLIPLFYFPTAPYFGPILYAWVSRNRKHLACKIDP